MRAFAVEYGMPGNTITLRPASAGDLSVIGGITARSWRHTFAGLLPDAFLSSLTPAAQQQRHERIFARAGVHYRVAVEDERVIGFASTGPCRDPRHAPRGEVHALYLEPGFERRGIGSRLFEAARAEARSSGLYLTTLSLNPNRAFYRARGGIEVEAPDIRLGGICYQQAGFLWP